jgi:dTDP-glucose 4,6-dehydratase
MRMLVTGGAGFIGSNFVKTTLANYKGDIDITVVDKLTYAGNLKNLAKLSERISFVKGDICDFGHMQELVKGSDLVVNFAAETHNDNSISNPAGFVETNVMGTLNLIRACVLHDARFHHISTDEVFGDLPLGSSDAFVPTTPYNPSSPYSASKAGSDHLVRAFVRTYGLRATLSNCSNNFGPNQHPEKLIPRTIHLAKNGIKPKIYGNGLNIRDWIHVDSHNLGIWKIIEKGKIGETYLLGANNQRTNLQVVQTILEALHLSSDFFEYVEDRPGHDLRYAIDASETKSKLDWTPAENNFEEELIDVISWYSSEEVDMGGLTNSGVSNYFGLKKL